MIEWRKTDDRVSAQLQDHIDELMEHGRWLQQFMVQYVTTQEFAGFRQAFSNYADLVDELRNTSEGRPSGLLLAVQGSVDKTVSESLNNLSLSLTGNWSSLAEEQHGRWSAALNERMNELQERSERLAEEVASQDANLSERVDQILGQVSERVEATMQWSTRDIAASTLQASQALAEELRASNQQECKALKQHFTRLIAGSGEHEMGKDISETEADGVRDHVHGLMQKFDDKLGKGVCNLQQAEHWRAESNLARQHKTEVEATLKETQDEVSDLVAQHEKLEQTLRDREEELEQLQAKLLEPVQWRKFKRQVEDVEARGRVRVNLQDGELEFVPTLEFMPKKPSEEPVASWKSDGIAEAAIADAAEVLSSLSGIEGTVESHTKTGKGAPAFWDRLTVNRADLVKESLESRGVPKGVLRASGLPGQEGLNKSSIRIKLAIFPPRVEPELQKSPKGKK